MAVLFLINKNKEDHPPDTSVIDDTIKTDPLIEPIDPEEERKLGSEFEFNTKEGDLKRILVKQKNKENRLIDGEKVTTFSSRITNYDIYIISEKNANEKNKLYYDKLYTCAISIQSECHTDKNEDCTPKTKVDLTNKIDRNDEGARNLQEIKDLKGLPIPVCLFNLTNNDVITSILCPESFPETKKKMLVLDLYFFRPPGIKRPTKENFNSTITRKTEGNRKYIREINGGICDIENAQFSFCTTDMNTTTDLENTILSYSEEAIMNITTDDKNSYIKTKTTYLVDESDKVENFNPEIYEENLNNIIGKLNPYFKYDELFSEEDFKELYIVSKKGMAEFKKTQKRKLDNDAKMIKKENNLLNLFTPESGIQVDLTLFNNMGINVDFMEADNNFYIENKKTDITKSKESSKNFNTIIKELIVLSKAGNHLATELYQKTNISLENMMEEINKAISTLNNMIKYQDLSAIFDSTLSLDTIKDLPYPIIQETSILRQKLDEILENVQNGGIKKYIKILNQNIYDYIDESRRILNGLFNNLNELSLSLSSSKSKLTEISTYYLNNTPTSYVSTIKKAQNILSNYYKDEYNLITPQVEKILNDFEKKLKESLNKEIKVIDNLCDNIENRNFSIKEANEEEYKQILNNLYYTKNYIMEIIEKINEKVRKEMDIKGNGYFISDYDLNSNQDSFSKIIEKSSKISSQLDNDEYIDITFDGIMKYIKSNFTTILKDMEKKKEELFPMDEDVLKSSTFTLKFQNEMKNDISSKGVDILNKIRRENDYYLEAKQRVVEEFVTNNKDDLIELVSELDNLFSVIKLEELANLYEKAFNSSLEKTEDEIHYNKNLAYEYFIGLTEIIADDDHFIELLSKYHIDEEHLPTCISRVPFHEVYLTSFSDSITQKSKTQGYLIKYNVYKDNLENSKLFVNEQLYPDLLSEYKNIISDIRQILQVFKNNKLSDKYPDLNELSFVDDHIRIIDNFYNRLDKYISDDIFNNRYIDLMKNYKEIQNKELLNISNNIESYHKIIDNYPLDDNYNYDFCLSFQRKKIYTCVNGCVGTYYNSDNYCLPAFSISNNHYNLTQHTIDTDTNINQFRSAFKEFNDELSDKINLYTSKINEFKQSLIDIETEAINQKYTLDYLSPIEESVNSLLFDKYGDQIINASYNYYQTNIKEIIEPLLDDISSQWDKFFDDIKTDIEKHLNDFKNSITELANMCGFYLAILTNNITNNYFNSIEEHQKAEFNYTITYYYNILLKLVKSSHQYVLSKIPSNQVGFNNLLNLRKRQVNDVFNNLIKTIENSQKEALNFEQQIYVAEVPDTNFFGINDILKYNIINTEKSLNAKLSEMRKLRNGKQNDEFSLSSRFYLENSESGKQIEDLYEQIIEKVFVYLNLDKFKELLIDNWIFDQDEFIKNLEDILYNSKLEVEKEFKIQKEKYLKSFEEEITKDYTKDDIAIKINNLYKNEIKSLENNQINDIENNINDILDKIRQEFIEEAIELKEKSNSYNKDFSKIENRIKKYKKEIIEKMKTNIFSVINEFNNNINSKIYTNFFEKYLNEYISESERTTDGYGKVVLLSKSYDIGQIIHSIILSLCNNYKKFIRFEIDSNYNHFYSEIENTINVNNLEKKIIETIDENYNSIILPALEQVATHDIGIQGYSPYDLDDNILNNINKIITEKMTNIKSIIDETKGNNYNFNLKDTKIWPKMDFSMVYQIILTNSGDLATFLSDEKENEKEKVDKYLEEVMISNFDDLLDNIIPSFGNMFFERVIKYNENFKISSLYNTLKYSIISTCTYYALLQGSGKIKALTKDLKLKIYSLNDLDITTQNRNNETLELVNKAVSQFIEESQDFIVGKYLSFFNNDVSIKQKFDGIMYQTIINKLYYLEDNFKNDYSNLLNKYLRDKLISSYTKVMNEKTREMVLSVEEKRELLKSKIDDLFSLDPDSVLQEINNKINNTLDSINNFNSHFKLFKISDNLINYLNNFGINNIQPKFERVINILNEETKNEILNTIDKNSEDYINYFNDKDFIEKSDESYNAIKENYIEIINASIADYGKEDYLDNLEKEIGRITDRLRRKRLRLLDEDEIEDERRERIADKAIDNTFTKLLSSSKNAQNFINNFEKFDNFDKIIDENINKLNIAYKKSSKRIKDNNYIEEINNNLTFKLSELKNLTLDYYTNIKNSFCNLKNYLINSINEINSDLNQCANITYSTFAEKYENLSKVEKINKNIDDNLGEEISDSTIVDNQNKITTVNYTISNIMKKAQFLFNLEFEEGEVKKPRIKASVINQSRPGQIKIKFINSQPEIGNIIQNIEVNTQDANFSINIDFTTSSKDLYVTTIADFQSFSYSKELIKIPLKKEEMEEDCIWMDGIKLCSLNENEYSEDNPEVLSSKRNQNIEGKKIVEKSILHESELFDLI